MNYLFKLGALLLSLASGFQLALAADTSDFTAAEVQLFVTPHLSGLTPPTRLNYLATRRGSLQSPFDDTATLAISKEDGKTISKVSYLSGAEKIELPPFPDMNGNPVLLHFLEREIREMKRLTGGSTNYYRKRIRMALATNPTVEKLTIMHQGKALNGTQIRISPYVDDPARVRYEKFATRHYVMTLSPEIPGGIVSLHSELRANDTTNDKTGLLWSETVSFKSQE
ncbi:MAG: hypothetical protein ACRBC3_03150 [Burkholderiaceae bacterium]